MIVALEAADTWRYTCSECTDTLRKKRGCKKPGYDLPLGGPPFSFSSPALLERSKTGNNKLFVLQECPVGYILRTGPYIYNVIDAVSRDENLSPSDHDRMSTYYHHAARLYSAEQSRLFELRQVRNKAKRDASVGAQMLKRRAQ